MAYESQAIALAQRLEPRDHIVDILIAERAPKLAASTVWPLARPLLYRLLDYRRARRMADAIAPLPAREALELVSVLLSLKVEALGLDRIPRRGRMVAVCNHPTGIADGVAVWDALSAIRPDTLFYANADALRVAPALRDVLIPVEWVEDKRTREGARATLQRTREAMEAERPLVVFPAGRLARRTPGGGLLDPPWAASAFSLARKFEAPIVPICLAGPWSSLFHFFDRFSGELRDITLFHELLNKRGGRFRLLIGHPVAPSEFPADAGEAAAQMKAYVEKRLPAEFGGRR
jgi:putative hemolysin